MPQPDRVPTPQDQVLSIVDHHWQGSCVGAATQLEIADHLDAGPLTVDVLAERTGTHAPSLFRLLRALESIGIFMQRAPQVFVNTPMSECLRRHAPGSQWAWLRICLCADSFVAKGWAGLMPALRTGETGFDQVAGCSSWDHLRAHPEEAAYFNAAMRDLSAAMTPAVAAAYDWSRFPVIADIGGGIGAQLTGILDAHPSCRGILFDQPQVVAAAPPHDRMEHRSGDFFAGVPVQADAYLMRWIIHDWPDERAAIILDNIRQAAPADARVAIVEWVLPDGAEPDSGRWMDINMLCNTSGCERTTSEFRTLYERAGFELDEIVPTASPLKIVIGRQRA